MLFATVRQRKIHVKKPDTVIQNGVNVDWLKLEMDDEWAEMDSIVCVFVNQYTEEVSGKLEKKEVSRQMLHTFGKEVRVPWECLEKTGTLSVSCTGYVDGEKVMTTMYPDSYWNVVQNGPVTGDETIEPTASLYEQILAAAGEAKAAAIAANEAKDQLLQDAANGVFDGADGKNAKVSVGSTQTGNPGSEAEVYSTGTDQDLKLNFVIPRGEKGEPGYTPVKGKDYFDGKDGKDGVRGCSILKIMTKPSSYTTTTGGFEPTYRVALSNVTSQSRVSEVLVGDVISYLYYLYPVGYVDDAYVYLGARTSIRGMAGEDGKDGKNGKDGKSITISNVYTTTVDGGVNTVTFSDGTYLQVTNGRKGSAGRNGTDGKDGYTPVKGVDYFDGKDGKDGQDGQPGKDGYTPIKGIDYFDGRDGQNGQNGQNGYDGVTPVFSIGTVETLEPGTNASASITGTAENPVLNLGIPKGMPGEGGSGSGESGEPGEDGGYYTPAVTQVNASTMQVRYSASKTGMPSVAAVNVTLPAGPKGEKGETGQTGPAGKDGAEGPQGPKGDTGEQGPEGPQGPAGTDGKDGKTPVKGTDYFTAADKQELVTAVLAALPAAEEATF